MSGLRRVLDARSVAVVGASRDERKRGYQAVRALIDAAFEGPVYPVNPREETVLGLRCYPSLADVPAPVDLVLATTPAATLPDIVKECGRKGVAGIVIVAGGFAELGARGRRLQERVVKLAAAAGVRVLGPNTSGMINVHSGLNLVGLSEWPRA